MNEIEQLKRDNYVLYRDNVSLIKTADRLRGENYKIRASNTRMRKTLEYLNRSITVTEHKLPFQLNKSKWLREIEAALEVKP